MSRFTGKTALVTGGGAGIGLSIALTLALEGADVIVTGRSDSSLAGATSAHNNITTIVADVGKSPDVVRIMELISKDFGRLDILINNAGMAPVTALTDQTLTEFDDVFNINVRAVVDLSSRALPLLKSSKGCIINISSAVASRPLPGMSVYCASKAALRSLTFVWAKELAKDGIRVNSVAVGPVETSIYDKTELSDDAAQAHKDRVTQLVPLGRFGIPQDIASAVAYLASDDTCFITGSDIAVDGGFSI
ncbi:SDR family oxidoreductase [Kluyvera intermedia]|uniref:SDR family NAD(P)-dependent oxidoreductase n=1 Tax=Kluyvera intermedia TaxID=61648 RepID=UPI00078793CB|nr:SDR family oxidoreductase [Kluyvera intermedia]WQD28093.1 SDR family oxidoreductase [Kluyvera intermedia]VDZ83644.1 3-oxoacyl-[acyl-carrier-protein] reductase FabG [Kluyvera intermedia]